MTREPDNSPRGRIEPVADWLQEVEFRRPPAASQVPAWRSRKGWRWAALLLLVLVAGVAVFRQPLARLAWPDTRVQRLLDDAESALRQGNLSAADGSGARQRFEAAQALDSDRVEAREGLARVAAAALAQSSAHLRAGRFDQARRSLALARELQVPRAQAESVADELRTREAAEAGIDGLVAQAESARGEGKLEVALPLYARVLALQPRHTIALEGREDALADLLQLARGALTRGDLAQGAGLVEQARQYDAGHVDLPDLQATLARALEQERREADAQLRRGKLEDSLSSYRLLLSVTPADASALQGLERVATAYAQRAAREASDFDFSSAEASLRKASALSPRAPVVKEAAQALARARQAQSRLASGLSPAERGRRTDALLVAMQQAEARGDWLTPPGESAYDRLRAAQALAPDAPAVKQAGARLLPATQACFEDELRANRIRRARTCFDAWLALAPRDARLVDARRRLSQKWIAVGDERLGSGEVAFAVQALAEARELDAGAPGLAEFSERVRLAQAAGN